MRTVPQGRLSVDSLGVTIRRQDGTKEPVALLPSDQSSQPWDWSALFNPFKNFWDALTGPGLVPQGAFMGWHYDLVVKPVPAGWLLCDGTNGTPNFEGMFLVGATAGAIGGQTKTPDPIYRVGETGGHDWIASTGVGEDLANSSVIYTLPTGYAADPPWTGDDGKVPKGESVLGPYALRYPDGSALGYNIQGNDMQIEDDPNSLWAADNRPRYKATHWIMKA